jgi:two-component system NtrC family sensor kinase
MKEPAPPLDLIPQTRYGVLRRNVVLAASLVAIMPLLIMTVLSAVQFENVYRAEAFGPLGRLTANAQHTLEFFLDERKAALRFVISNSTLDQLSQEPYLQQVFHNLSQAFGGFVDLGLIDSDGRQRSYVGPYDLLGKVYLDQDWFHEVRLRGEHVSDVFMGYRRFPHFVMAVKYEDGQGRWHALRATIDSEELTRRVREVCRDPEGDAFLVNRAGVLQTPSKNYGQVLARLPLALPPYSREAKVVEVQGEGGNPLLVGYSYIDQSPFVFFLVSNPRTIMAAWHKARRELIIFAAFSVLLILGVIWVSATVLVRRIREADEKRAAILHRAEYTQRMASVGRLAAGVAHEINNPLAIIGEKAGLISDLIGTKRESPHQAKVLQLVQSIDKAVDRASRVTHRLLGFARHIDVERERISLEELIREVLGFLEKEASHRNVTLAIDSEEDLPLIVSDRGQLQQVFLNIINNSLAAVADGTGRIDITLRRGGGQRLVVEIADNGSGIEPQNIGRVFEPFFTTKKGYGTGLGLSITYGIVKKLGGEISVTSEPGRWTRFTVELPVTAPEE